MKCVFSPSSEEDYTQLKIKHSTLPNLVVGRLFSDDDIVKVALNESRNGAAHQRWLRAQLVQHRRAGAP